MSWQPLQYMKMFSRTTYDKEGVNLIDYLDNPSTKYKRRMSGNSRPIGTGSSGLKRGFSGFHQPQAVSANKMKDFNQIFVAPVHPAKPILSSFRKKEQRPLKLNFLNTKAPFRQTAAGFMSTKEKQRTEERFCQTAVNGFGLHDRPMSKQQPRSNKPNIKQADREKQIQEVEFDIDDADSNIEEMDEEDREMILNFQKLGNQTDVVHREQRPQTSKGFRKKMTSSSDLEVSPGEDLIEQLRLPLRKKAQGNLQQLKIPIRSMYQQRKKDCHPSSAHPKNHSKLSKQFDDLFKVTTSSPKKNSIDVNTPFESLIGSQFLSLFANCRD